MMLYLYIAEISKHKGPPVFTEEERYKIVRAIKWVDEVCRHSCVSRYMHGCWQYLRKVLSVLILINVKKCSL